MSIRWRNPMLMAPEGDSWLSALPDDLKTDPNVAKFKTPADLAKGYVEASKLIGGSIRPPGPDAAPEARQEYLKKVLETAPELIVAGDEDGLYKRLGRPEKEEEYEVDEATAKLVDLAAARRQAKEAGLTKKQFQALAKQTAAAREQAEVEAGKAHQALKQEWGYAHADKVLAAAAAARKMGMDDATVAAIASGTVPAQQLRFFYAASRVAGVDAKEMTREREASGAGGKLSPAEAKARLAEIRGRDEFWSPAKNPAEHERLVAESLRLTEMTLTG